MLSLLKLWVAWWLCKYCPFHGATWWTYSTTGSAIFIYLFIYYVIVHKVQKAEQWTFTQSNNHHDVYKKKEKRKEKRKKEKVISYSSSTYESNKLLNFGWRQKRTAESTLSNKQQLKQRQHRSSKLCRDLRVHITWNHKSSDRKYIAVVSMVLYFGI